MSNIKTEVVSSFERNGKTYLVLELDVPQGQGPSEQMQAESWFPGGLGDLDWPPKWDDLNFDVTFTDGKLCLVISYKGDKKWESCFQVLEGCYEPDDIDLFGLGPIIFYMKSIKFCPIDNGINVSFQVWAKCAIGKTKLGEFSKDITA
ncbi:hypothetical protein LT232_20510 [Bacillus velezensis]|uniref:hypothetical protein n=1 Tax=Bacillus velezensis TaxID=492670 RepID=UPI001F379BF3|nr:hypothetical protein [Bacillus velezensis]UGW84560.1 hypothetical protein LT232_20510 [Bacillus velezensis]